jgi:hypothetical protein
LFSHSIAYVFLTHSAFHIFRLLCPVFFLPTLYSFSLYFPSSFYLPIFVSLPSLYISFPLRLLQPNFNYNEAGTCSSETSHSHTGLQDYSLRSLLPQSLYVYVHCLLFVLPTLIFLQ